MTITAAEARAAYETADRLYSLQEVEAAMDRMAGEITARFRDLAPLVLCVMNGGLIPAGRLLTRLDFPLHLDYVHATRYRGATSGGELKWLKRPSEPLAGRHLLIIDDILDEGYTLEAIVAACRAEGAASVASAVAVEKRHDRGCGYRADFVGLEVPDRYVFGYGMDYKEYLRNAPGIFAVQGL